jgi:hypothetical protein
LKACVSEWALVLTISDVINSINYKSAVEEIKDFIIAYVEKAKARGVVVGPVAASILASLLD